MSTVTITQGRLAGNQTGGIHSFKGIPFAAPISGHNRWLPPRQAENWSGTRDATKFGNACPQEPGPSMRFVSKAGRKFIRTIDMTGPQGDDCLNLNVWTPSLDPDAKLPVMVWIHGGAFLTGAGSMPHYDGTNLAQKGVVLVSINYRLGIMGSFTAPNMFEHDFCGPNRGFEDQLAALRWVQDNIKNFGGDADNVTIFGESAGGQSIAVLLASPSSKELFKRAIVQSGTPEFCTSYEDHQNYAADLLQAIGVKAGDTAAISALSAADTIAMMGVGRKLLRAKNAAERYGDLAVYGGLGCAYGTPFMPVPILKSLAQGVAKDVDLMIGTVKEDGRLFPLVMPGPEALAARLCMAWFQNLMIPRRNPKLVFERYKKVMSNATGAEIRGQIMTDAMFRRGSVRAAEIHAQSAPGRTYLYQFDWSSPVPGIGAMHGIDMPFVTQNLDAFEEIIGDVTALHEMADIVSDAWVNFAKTGKPTAAMPEWQPFDKDHRATMVFDTKIELQHDIDGPLREIWYG